MSEAIIVTGANGQDGAYLCRSLLDQGYAVHGCVRRGSTNKLGRLTLMQIEDRMTLHQIDVTDFPSVFNLVRSIKPKFIYNLAAQSFVQDSFVNPSIAMKTNFDAVLNFLEAIRVSEADCGFYQASTSEMYGDVLSDPQSEDTPFNPLSPYAVGKVAAHHLVKNYRVAYGLNCVSGILFNHESELRGREFVTRKITSGLARIVHGDKVVIKLGNCDSKRDWGYAPDYVEAMQLILQKSKARDYVVATNKVMSVREFFLFAAECAGFRPEIEGEGIAEKCVDGRSGQTLYSIDERYYRPSDVVYLRGDNSLIYKDLGWKPIHSVQQIAEKMVTFDMKLASGSIAVDYAV